MKYDPRKLGNPDYKGRSDYQGRHDVYEMPEKQKPSGRVKIPLDKVNKVALIVIASCIGIVLLLTCVALMQRSTGF